MGYYLLDLTQKDKWNELLKSLPLLMQDVYFSPEYYLLYENLGDGKAQCFVFENEGDLAIYPFLKNSINSLGYILDDQYYDIQGAYGYNGVIFSTLNNTFIKKFYLAFKEYVSESKIIAEFTRFHPLINNKSFSEEFMNVIFDRHTIFLDMNKTVDDIFCAFQRTTRKQIKRGIHTHNIKVVVDNSSLNIDEFYSIYNETMDRVESDDYLYFNKSYFKELIATVPAIFFSAYLENEMIASIICLKGNHFLHGHLGGAKTQYLKYSPYSVLYFEIIKEAKKDDYQKIHFGGGSTPKDDDPLLRFKMNFSDSLSEFYIGKKIHNENIYNNLIKQWSKKSPEKVPLYKNFLLKYRY